ncbi:helix-turn-helix domain-containing protein [Providencia sp. PROV111]|uniref:helix-turn-helix domain-containing protein n=1 Tax=Providencia sp. PROV111 TaxID=2949822 RepID=UPI00234A48B7|nr:helix-turn-helix transcriptional regulator [Providencia sp. PROV111]
MSHDRELCRRFGLFLRYIRGQRHLTGQQLAEQLMLSQQQISRYERGITVPTICMVNKMLHTLEVPWPIFIREVIEKDNLTP